MTNWWNALTALNRFFYGAAFCVSIPFIWQLAAALMGLDADDVQDGDPAVDDLDTADGDADMPTSDAIATVLAFKLLSVRSLLAFLMLFLWAAALYLDRGVPVARALGVSLLWGFGGLISVGLLLFLLPRLAHTGNRDLTSAVGSEATVYLDIPAHGTGEVRANVDGVVNHIKAHALHGIELKAGQRVTIVRRIGQTTVEVEAVPET